MPRGKDRERGGVKALSTIREGPDYLVSKLLVLDVC